MHNFVYEVIGTRKPKKHNLKYRKDGAHTLVIDYARGGILVSLNNTSAYVLERCDGVATIEKIAREMQTKYSKVEYEKIISDVVKCVRDLESMNLVTVIQ